MRVICFALYYLSLGQLLLKVDEDDDDGCLSFIVRACELVFLKNPRRIKNPFYDDTEPALEEHERQKIAKVRKCEHPGTASAGSNRSRRKERTCEVAPVLDQRKWNYCSWPLYLSTNPTKRGGTSTL